MWTIYEGELSNLALTYKYRYLYYYYYKKKKNNTTAKAVAAPKGR
jgi:hypothetical protein